MHAPARYDTLMSLRQNSINLDRLDAALIRSCNMTTVSEYLPEGIRLGPQIERPKVFIHWEPPVDADAPCPTYTDHLFVLCDGLDDENKLVALGVNCPLPLWASQEHYYYLLEQNRLQQELNQLPAISN